MKARSRILPLLALACAVAFSGRARAELLIYDLSFSNLPTTVNYAFAQDGFLVVDRAAGTFSSVIVLVDPNTALLYSTTSLLSGTYTTMLSEGNGNEYAVLASSSAAGSGADNLAFQVVGELSSGVPISRRRVADVARTLRGVLFASAAESSSSNATTSNSTTGNSTTSNATFTFGFAGQSRVRAELDRGLTRDANGSGLDSAGALAIATAILENRGVLPKASPSPSPTPTPVGVTP